MLLGDSGQVLGVRLKNGAEIRSKIVLSNATLKVTFNDLLPSGALPQLYMDKVNSIDYTSPVVKINGIHHTSIIPSHRLPVHSQIRKKYEL